MAFCLIVVLGWWHVVVGWLLLYISYFVFLFTLVEAFHTYWKHRYRITRVCWCVGGAEEKKQIHWH